MLASYRCAPHPSLDWYTPAEKLHGRQLKNLLSLFLPRTTSVSKPDKNIDVKPYQVRSPKYCVGDLVFARNYASGAKWFKGVVTKNVGSVKYLIRIDRGIWKRHQNQLQPRFFDLLHNDSDATHDNDLDTAGTSSEQSCSSSLNRNASNDRNTQMSMPQRRYPVRNRRAPDFYQAGFPQ